MISSLSSEVSPLVDFQSRPSIDTGRKIFADFLGGDLGVGVGGPGDLTGRATSEFACFRPGGFLLILGRLTSESLPEEEYSVRKLIGLRGELFSLLLLLIMRLGLGALLLLLMGVPVILGFGGATVAVSSER